MLTIEIDEATGGAVPAQSSSVDRLWDLILEQRIAMICIAETELTHWVDERLISLERNVNGLLNALEDNGIFVPASGVLDSYTESAVPAKQNVGENGVRLRELNGRGSDGEDYEPVRLESVPLQQISQVTETKGPSRVQKRTSQLFPSSLTSSTTSNVPLTSDSSTFQDSLSPTAASAAYPFGPANTNGERNQPASKPSAIHPPPFARLISGTAILGASAASPPSASGSVPSSTPPTALQPLSSSSTRAPHSLPPSTASGSGVSPNPPAFAIRSSSTGPSDRERSRAKDAAHSAAKSFRVTLEDPCWKVLPAALKKYKINDDWKMYALFICFGNTGALLP